jgi:dethiobiotin synthetase
MAAFFVTGSGTDIGKTWVSAALLRHWRAKGLAPGALKPVATGYDPARPQDSDAAALLTALGRPIDAPSVEAITPFRFRAPLSPDQAARREGVRLTARGVAEACAAAIAGARGPVIVEGAGGVMSPLSETETMLDLAAALDAPVIFVGGSYLGAISHALTGLAVLRARGCVTPLVLVNETPGSPVDLRETTRTLADHAPAAAVLPIPRGADDAVWGEASRVLLAPPGL